MTCSSLPTSRFASNNLTFTPALSVPDTVPLSTCSQLIAEGRPDKSNAVMFNYQVEDDANNSENEMHVQHEAKNCRFPIISSLPSATDAVIDTYEPYCPRISNGVEAISDSRSLEAKSPGYGTFALKAQSNRMLSLQVNMADLGQRRKPHKALARAQSRPHSPVDLELFGKSVNY
ncbi:unnamed protein product [Protopolystoma xenopodis]|uniref:Uncharacterized protein n=1 Tax=Protopolystoma xenopodis TaxID=117903 RepID=A0A448XA88_9PLAT|nr:unnamed protein product [Protopolystoma xenopodis]